MNVQRRRQQRDQLLHLIDHFVRQFSLIVTISIILHRLPGEIIAIGEQI